MMRFSGHRQTAAHGNGRFFPFLGSASGVHSLKATGNIYSKFQRNKATCNVSQAAAIGTRNRRSSKQSSRPLGGGGGGRGCRHRRQMATPAFGPCPGDAAAAAAAGPNPRRQQNTTPTATITGTYLTFWLFHAEATRRERLATSEQKNAERNLDGGGVGGGSAAERAAGDAAATRPNGGGGRRRRKGQQALPAEAVRYHSNKHGRDTAGWHPNKATDWLERPTRHYCTTPRPTTTKKPSRSDAIVDSASRLG